MKLILSSTHYTQYYTLQELLHQHRALHGITEPLVKLEADRVNIERLLLRSNRRNTRTGCGGRGR